MRKLVLKESASLNEEQMKKVLGGGDHNWTYVSTSSSTDSNGHTITKTVWRDNPSFGYVKQFAYGCMKSTYDREHIFGPAFPSIGSVFRPDEGVSTLTLTIETWEEEVDGEMVPKANVSSSITTK